MLRTKDVVSESGVSDLMLAAKGKVAEESVKPISQVVNFLTKWTASHALVFAQHFRYKLALIQNSTQFHSNSHSANNNMQVQSWSKTFK